MTVLITGDDLQAAGAMNLRSTARSPEAVSLVNDLLDAVIVPSLTSASVRPSSMAKHRAALGATIGDLLKFEAEGRCGAHGVRPCDFEGLGFGRSIFMQQRGALEAAGLLHHVPGRQRLHRFTNQGTGLAQVTSGGGMVSRFRLTPEALRRIEAAGVSVSDWKVHWQPVKPSPTRALPPSALVGLTATKGPRVQGTRPPGLAMTADFAHPKVVAMVADLQDHNEFMLAADVGGMSFRGLRRLFANGDAEGFDWQWHGRFYSVRGGDGYERWKGAARRRDITMAGEGVGEADMRSSQLTILYALQGQPLPAGDDLYAVAGLDRELVKNWFTQALGSGSAKAVRWSLGARQYYGVQAPGRTLSADVPIGPFAAKVLKAHPVLEGLGSPGFSSVHDTMFHEAEVLRGAMASLRSRGIPSLPVHDSLIVPVGSLDCAAAALITSFRDHIGGVLGRMTCVVPTVKLKTA